jgi:excisionase family DNA binding protein
MIMGKLCIVRRRKSESAPGVAENLDHSLADRRRNRAERASNRICLARDYPLRGDAAAPDDQELSIELTPSQADVVKPRAYFKVLQGGKADRSSVGVQRSDNGEIAFNFYFKQVYLSKLFTASDVCDMVHVSKAFLTRLVKTGKLKSHKVGRTRRFSLEDVFARLGESLKARPKGGNYVF